MRIAFSEKGIDRILELSSIWKDSRFGVNHKRYQLKEEKWALFRAMSMEGSILYIFTCFPNDFWDCLLRDGAVESNNSFYVVYVDREPYSDGRSSRGLLDFLDKHRIPYCEI